jgi:hypothetical protein
MPSVAADGAIGSTAAAVTIAAEGPAVEVPSRRIDIRPPSNIYDTFGRLNYRPWYAIAEFVDNATQNFFYFERELRPSSDDPATLEIDIRYDGASKLLSVTDTAHGMNFEEFSRAIRLNEPPPDKSGRSEFGMGLKTAACWFGHAWTLRSTRLGDTREYLVRMDLDELNRTKPHEIDVDVLPAKPSSHGTTIEIRPLRKPLFGRQIERIRQTLASMYRFDLASGIVSITWNASPLLYSPEELWEEELPDGKRRVWRQEFAIDVADPSNDEVNYPITGWVGVRATMSNVHSGLDLFRRKRLIIGGPGEGWRPKELCGDVGSPEWKRLTGELHLDTFPVNFSKDGFAWDGALEEAVIDTLKPLVDDYRRKAHNLRTRGTELAIRDLERAAEDVKEGLASEDLKRDLARLETPARPERDPTEDPEVLEELLADSRGPEELRVATPTGDLVARIYLNDADARLEWLSLSFVQPDEVDVFLNTRHPFVAKHSQDDASIAMLSKFALALALAEKRARMLTGERIRPDDLRTHLDAFLRHATQ